MSFGFGSSKTKSKSSSQQDPWEPTIPYLEDYLGGVGNLSTEPLTGTQVSALGDLSNIYGEGNQFAGQLTGLANDFFTGPQSQSSQLGDAYGALQNVLTPYAEGKYLDFKENPYIQEMLTNVGDSVQQRINAQFAGAGRDLSGMNQKSVASGVTEAQLPILANLFTQQQANQLGAANTLFNAGNTTATGMQGLDTAALQARAGALPIADAATNASLWGPLGQYNVDAVQSSAPYEKYGQLASLLLPVAQLGQQQSGTGSSSTTGFNVGAKLLSDERLKEDLQQIGTLADGTPIYRFKYKGEDTTRIGLSAQDLENVTPEAVHEYDAPQAGTDDGRVKYVDMDAATRRSADMLAGGEGPGLLDQVEGNVARLPAPRPRPMLEDELFMQRGAA